MNDWKVFAPDDKDTFPLPSTERMFVVIKDNIPILCTFPKDCFMDMNCNFITLKKPTIYMNIGEKPKGIREHTVYRCSPCCREELLQSHNCPYEDDGYCFDKPKNINCPIRKKVKEYSVFMKGEKV